MNPNASCLASSDYLYIYTIYTSSIKSSGGTNLTLCADEVKSVTIVCFN